MAKDNGNKGEIDLRKLQGDERMNEALKALGVNPEEATTLSYTIWAPWDMETPAHADDPIAFKGVYEGYKLIQKEIQGNMSVFGGFMFKDAMPPSKSGAPWIVLNKILLGDLSRVLPGTEVCIVYKGSARNVHGGQTRDVQAVITKADRKNRVADKILPPMNGDLRLLTGGREAGDDDAVPGDAPF